MIKVKTDENKSRLRMFKLTFSGAVTLSEEEVDLEPNETLEDLANRVQNYSCLGDLLQDWNLEDDIEIVISEL